MHRGYVKLWRKSLDSGMLSNPELWRFWCYCLLKATHKPMRQVVGFQEIDLEPGEFIFGRNKAAQELHTTERKIRTCLDSLRKRKKVTTKTTNKFSIISIVNWPTYQSESEQDDQQDDQPVTNKRPASDHKQEHQEHKEKISIAQSDNGNRSDQPAGDPLLSIPLIPKDGEFLIYQQDIDQWSDVYPGVDVLSELKKIRLWNEDNPARRKTAKGIRRHISSWLDRAQNGKGQHRPPEPDNDPYPRLN